MLNVLQSHMLTESLVDKETFEARQKAKNVILKALHQDVPSDTVDISAWGNTEVERPLGGGFDSSAEYHTTGPLPPETVPTDDAHNPFPMLDAPLG